MKKFINRIIVFSLVFIFIASICYGLNLFMYNKMGFSTDKKIIMVGDSHIKNGLNPKWIPNSINIAQNGEPIIVTYHKLNKILEHCDPQQVVLGISVHTFSKASQDERYLNTNRFKTHAKRYKAFMDYEKFRPFIGWKDYFLVFLNNNIVLDFNYVKAILYDYLSIRTHKWEYIGGFYDTTESFLHKVNLKTKIEEHYVCSNDSILVSTLSEEYLKKIIELSEKRGFKLVLVNTPLHKSYVEKIPKNIHKHYEKITKKISEENFSVKLLDFSNLILDDNYFFDYDHINSKGAKVISTKVARELKNNIEK